MFVAVCLAISYLRGEITRLSEHSKKRMKQRTVLNHRERKSLFRKVLDNGKSPSQIKNEELKKYLNCKQRNHKIKLYNNYVFIYSKNNKKLITMYKIPDTFIGLEDD